MNNKLDDLQTTLKTVAIEKAKKRLKEEIDHYNDHLEITPDKTKAADWFRRAENMSVIYEDVHIRLYQERIDRAAYDDLLLRMIEKMWVLGIDFKMTERDKSLLENGSVEEYCFED